MDFSAEESGLVLCDLCPVALRLPGSNIVRSVLPGGGFTPTCILQKSVSLVSVAPRAFLQQWRNGRRMRRLINILLRHTERFRVMFATGTTQRL